VPAAGLVSETQVMRQEKPGRGGPLGPLDWCKMLPFEAAASSDRMGWAGLEAARFRAAPAFEINSPPLPTTRSPSVLLTSRILYAVHDFVTHSPASFSAGPHAAPTSFSTAAARAARIAAICSRPRAVT
jgi:hypothetical protein